MILSTNYKLEVWQTLEDQVIISSEIPLLVVSYLLNIYKMRQLLYRLITHTHVYLERTYFNEI
jgi:hypothetical protein